MEESSQPPNQQADSPSLQAPSSELALEKGNPELYCLCGDNIDITVKPRFMRTDKHKTTSLHYFHSYAVQNRIDFSDLSETVPMALVVDVHQLAASLLPTPDDDVALRNNIAVLVSRILVTNIDFFKFAFDGVVEWHIRHEFSKEMSAQSQVVGACSNTSVAMSSHP